MMRTRATLAVLATVLVLGLSALVLAQQAGGQDSGSGRDRGRSRGGFDPAQWRQDRLDRMKDELGAKDDEWQVLQPKVEKIMKLQMESFASRLSGRRDRGSDRGSDRGRSEMADSAVGKASADLRSALDDKSIAPEEIAKRLATLRQARESVKQEMAKAQQEVKELLSQRQEAVMVMNGMLD
jgi:chromosome segregation ATPase